ncbi:NADH-FMN oxidoreductase RutF, flavin reductase (DIM6/NTAB) family [Andreprevotia lacus DSM 23236]|jgi:flavin reductase (DIM6/NTAB) family NADH-FMN oxidoreductase RutF|uniref:NADH-FMN oxidoreductase RutF, flavin reductase (DIM6/NTAB) family n=1 Tax=Andreprevotia lacus DSM 23236 TaxID=1121001 RepID=A0A1W1XZB0_9NEIS|nr:flavin reductase family protein [Andreprevotia lacus]SMC29309.1 NADH-FMN oxidoreductase RutF, flavin reductase (DIM6/NTAB) family [Andreprevotia lacus DSM 23236]
MSHIAVPLPQACRLLNHGPTVLVTSAHAGRCNIMAAAWNTVLDFDPPKFVVVIDKNTYTRELIEASGTLALQIPSRAQAELTYAVGNSSGRDGDKFATHKIATFAGSHIEAPLVEGCLAWLECKIIPEPHNQQTYDLFIVEAVAAWADPQVYSDGRWHFADGAPRSIHHVAGGAFFEAGELFRARQD